MYYKNLNYANFIAKILEILYFFLHKSLNFRTFALEIE